MAFNKPLPVWNEPGVEVPSAIKNSGWGAGIKPPAPYFNNLHHKTYEALKELQEKAAETAEVQEISGNLTEADERLTTQLAQTEIKDLIYKKSILLELPFKFPDYQNALDKDGIDYMFPQGLAIEEISNELFIAYWNTGMIGNWIVVYELTTGTYKRCFRINSTTASSQGEGLVLRREGANRYLYSKVTGTKLSKFDITTLPSNLSYNEPVAEYEIGLRQHFAFNDGKWYVQQAGVMGSEHNKGLLYYIFDESFNKIGAILMDNAVGGYRSGALSPYGTKTQGVTAINDALVQIEGSYTTKSTNVKAANYHGLKIIDFDGRLITDGTLEPIATIEILEANGYTTDFIEYEAIYATKNGIFSLCLNIESTNPLSTSKGVIIFKEFSNADDAIDFSSAKKRYPKINKSLIAAECLYPVGRDGSMINPLNGGILNTLNSILDFMNAASIRTFAFHTQYTTVTGLDGEALENNALYELFAIDTGRFFMSIKRHAGTVKEYSITGTTTRTITKLYDPDIQRYKLTTDDGTAIYPSGYTRLRDLPPGQYYLTGGNAVNFTDLPFQSAGFVEVIKASGDSRLIRFTATTFRNAVYEQIIIDGTASEWQILNKTFNGVGSPEGLYNARAGTFYRDTANGNLYHKITDSGNTGWKKVTLT